MDDNPKSPNIFQAPPDPPIARWKKGVIAGVLAVAVILMVNAFTHPGNKIFVDPSPAFKCTICGKKRYITIRELQILYPTTMPTTQPMRLLCEDCQEPTMTLAVRCPECNEIFVPDFEKAKGKVFEDHCPACGMSYITAWRKKHPETESSHSKIKEFYYTVTRTIQSWIAIATHKLSGR